MDRSDFLQGVSVIAAAAPLTAAAPSAARSVAGITVPDSPLAREADGGGSRRRCRRRSSTTRCERFCSPSS